MKSPCLRFFHNFLRKIQPSHYNDLILRPKRAVHDGQQPANIKVAIYLIFPKFGVLESHLHSLRYLIENGYSPFIVSNLPLHNADLAQLLPLAWRVTVRENFGYDFGGYRDAILDLVDRLPSLKRLVFLNDSSWFPMNGSKNWLLLAEESGVDVYGADLHREIAPYAPAKYDTMLWTTESRGNRRYYASYAISIGQNVLKSKGYLQFWKNLRLSDGKGRTVRRGEHGHSNWLCAQGFSHDALSKSAEMQAILAQMPDAQFDLLWSMLLPARQTKVQKIYASLQRSFVDDAMRDAQRKLIKLHISWTGIAICIPHYAITCQGYPFLKKSLYGQKSDRLRKIVTALNDPLTPIMLHELDLLDQKNQP